MAEVHISIQVNTQSEPYKLRAWMELDPAGRVSLVCPECRRSTSHDPLIVAAGTGITCPLCGHTASSEEGLFATRPDLLEAALEPAISEVKDQIADQLEKAFRGLKGVTVKRR